MFTIKFQLNERSVKAMAKAHVIVFAPYFMRSMLAVSVVFIYMGLFVFDSNIIKIIILAFGCWIFMISQYPTYKQVQNLRQIFNHRYPLLCYDFVGSHFSVSGIGCRTYLYADISELFIYSTYLLILMHSKQLLLIDATALSKEDIVEFKLFIAQKAAKKWRRCCIISL